MKKIQIQLYTLVATLLLSVNVNAQGPLYEKANEMYRQLQYSEAIPAFKDAYEKEKDNATKSEILFKIAECYRYTLNTENSITWYRKAIQANHPDSLAQLYLAEALKASGKYDEAKVEYEIYSEIAPNDDRGAKGAESCKLAKKWMSEKSKISVENLVQANTKFDDFGPVFGGTKDGKTTVIISSNRKGVKGDNQDLWLGQKFTDLFVATRDTSGEWSSFESLGDNINTEANEGAAAISADGEMLFFTRCESVKKEVKYCKIWATSKNDEAWGEPVMLNLVPDSSSAGQPALSPDGKTMYFVSDMSGSVGGKDIWKATSSDGKSFANVENVGAVNTLWDERWPSVKPDGTLHFSSQGHTSMGGLDIFKVVNGQVLNLKPPINSAGDDFAIAFESGSKGYFTSNREGSNGYDIYSFVEVALSMTLTGVVTDSKIGEPVAGATVTITGDDGTKFITTTDENGFYKFTLTAGQKDENGNVVSETGSNYDILVESADHFKARTRETTIGSVGPVTKRVNFTIDPKVEKDVAIDLPHIEYDFNKATLRPESKVALNKLIKTLNDNPKIKIELQSHTDSRGSHPLNMRLSQARAKSVVDYLIQNGVKSERLVAKGYGETKLLYSDADIAKLKTKEEKEEAHQRNRRTAFSVINYDYTK
jgi:peptidoglycan-associated lipoprotein